MRQGDDDDDDNGGNGGNGTTRSARTARSRRSSAACRRRSSSPRAARAPGFIVRSDGVILTNAHVVNGASEVMVRLTDRREYTAKVIGVDTKSDIAVIKIEAKDLPTVKIGDSHSLKVGEWVLAIGAPFGFENSATAGIVSAKGRTLDSGVVPFIQTDVPINPGNSGGPLFNMRGEVVGINSQIYSRSGGYMGVSFSIPIDVAMGVSQQLQTTGHVTRGKVGVTIQRVNQGLADSFGLPQPEGALVSSVEKGGPAEKAGIEPGDVILKLNGEPLKDSSDLSVQIAADHPRHGGEPRGVAQPRGARTSRVTLGALEDKRTAANARPARAGRQARTGGAAAVPRGAAPGEHEGRRRGRARHRALRPMPASSRATWCSRPTVPRSPAPRSCKAAVEKSKGHVALLIQRGEARLFVPVRVG